MSSDNSEKLTPVLVSEGCYTKWCRSLNNDPPSGYNFVDIGDSEIIWFDEEGIENIEIGLEPSGDSVKKRVSTEFFLNHLFDGWKDVELD